jgi:hypothetical protein
MGNFFDGPVIIFIIYAFIYLTFIYIKLNNNITGKKHLSYTNSSRIFSIMKIEIIITFITIFFIGFLNIFNVHFLSWIISITIIILSIYVFFQRYYVIFELNNKKLNERENIKQESIEQSNTNSNINDLSDNNLNDINQRIDRDEIRKNFYDKVDNIYGLNTIEKNKYDLSNNNIKYQLVNHEIKMPSFYNPINYILKNLINNNFDNNFDNNFNNNFNNELNYYIYPNNNPNFNNPVNRILNIPNYNNTDAKITYDNRYNNEFFMDEIIKYKNAKFQETKDLLTIQEPNISDIEINKYLDIEWKNLSDAEKSVWKKNT